MQWQPTADQSTLVYRAKLLHQLREFFSQRGVLEVETPVLAASTIPDPNILSMQTHVLGKSPYFLQTSPEFAMKRLLASGSGDIFQICKAFRNDEAGRWHNPEFTLLEWYRLGFDHLQLMDEVDQLIQQLLNTEKAQRLSYRQLFLHYLGIDPFVAEQAELHQVARQRGLQDSVGMESASCDDWLQLLLTHYIEPQLKQITAPVFIYDFPVSQAALARIRPGNPPVAELALTNAV